MANYRVTFKSKGSRQVMLLEAKSDEEARELAEETQRRRHARFPLTFQRLEQSLETGETHPLLAASPRLVKDPELMKKVMRAQVELRKRDQARYDDEDLKIDKVEKLD